MLLLATSAFLAIVVTFLCILSEAVLLSITPLWLKQHQGALYSRKIKRLCFNMHRTLFILSTAKTALLTVTSVFIGYQSAIILKSPLSFSIAICTILFLILCTAFLAKMLGKKWWYLLAPAVGYCLDYPIRYTLTLIKSCRLFILPLHKEKQLSNQDEARTEFEAMTEIAHIRGGLAENERCVVKNLLLFRTTPVSHIVTPRTVIFSLDEQTTVQQYMASFIKSRFTRIPVFKEHSDHICGFVLRSEIMAAHYNGKTSTCLKKIKRPLMSVYENEPLNSVLSRMLAGQIHIIQVTDQYQQMKGIITLEDVIESLLGTEIIDESDHNVDMQQVARKKRMRWLRKHRWQMFSSCGKLEPACLPLKKAS